MLAGAAGVAGCGGGSETASPGATTQPIEVYRDAVTEMFRQGQRAVGLGTQPLAALGIAFPTRDRAVETLTSRSGAGRQEIRLEVRTPGGLLTGTVTGTPDSFTANVSGSIEVGPAGGQTITVRVVHTGARDQVTFQQGETQLSLLMEGTTVLDARGTVAQGSETWTLDTFVQTQSPPTQAGAPPTVAAQARLHTARGDVVEWELDHIPQPDGTISQTTVATHARAGGGSFTTRETLSLLPYRPSVATEPPAPDGQLEIVGHGTPEIRAAVAIVDGRLTKGNVYRGAEQIGTVAFADGKWELRPVGASSASAATYQVDLDAEVMLSILVAVL